MNTETIKQIIADAPSPVSLSAAIYTLRDCLQQKSQDFTCYKEETIVADIETMEDILCAIRNINRAKSTLESLKQELN